MVQMNPVSPQPLPWESDFGHALNKLRTDAGISQYALARQLRELGLPFHQQLVDRIERGSRAVRLNEAVVIARFFGTPLEDMFDTSPDADSSLDAAQRTLESAARTAPSIAHHLQRARDEALEAATQASRVENWLEKNIQESDTALKELSGTTPVVSWLLTALAGTLDEAVRDTERAIDEASRRSPVVNDWIGIR